jgi:hypothetical protein
MGRFALIVTFLGLLAAAPALPTTESAWAKPYPLVPGPEPTNGDPTGDDRPNPTPKSTRRTSSFRSQDRIVTRSGAVIDGTRGAWRLVLRHLMAISLR